MKILSSRNPGSLERRRSGSALVLSLIAVMVVTVLAGSYLELSSSVAKRQGRAADRKQAFYMAEAGLSEAYTGMWIGRSGEVGSMAAPARFGDGLFWVEVEDLGEGFFKLDSTGMYGSGRATLGLVVQEGRKSVASLGVFSEDALDVPPGTRIDRYDSNAGEYSEQWDANGLWIGSTAPLPVSVGSNDAITVESTPEAPTSIQGSVTPGESAAVTTIGSPEITGALDPRALNATLPPVGVPAITVGSGVTHSGATPYTLDPGEHGLAFLDVSGGSQVVVNGPATLVLGDLRVSPGADLRFDTTLGPVDVYVTGALDLQPSSVLSTTSTDPTAVTIQVAGTTDAQLDSAGGFFGAIYAPQATIGIGSDFELFGLVIGKHLDLSPGAQLHFDHHLAVLDAARSLPTQKSWRIVDFAPIGSTSDPFDNLGVVKSMLLPPADAHKDQWLDITYDDLSGTLKTYSGLESGFDWSLVKDVIDCTRDGETTDLMNTGGQLLLSGQNLLTL